MYHSIFYQTAAYQKQQELSQSARRHRFTRKNTAEKAYRTSVSSNHLAAIFWLAFRNLNKKLVTS